MGVLDCVVLDAAAVRTGGGAGALAIAGAFEPGLESGAFCWARAAMVEIAMNNITAASKLPRRLVDQRSIIRGRRRMAFLHLNEKRRPMWPPERFSPKPKA